MQSWRRFRSLSAADRVIVVEAGALLLVTRLVLAAAPFLFVRRALRAYARLAVSRRARARHDATRIAWAVAAAARHVPVTTTCLVESLAAEAMLLRRGMPCVLRLGVRPPQSGRVLDAHAWVECGGGVVAGAVDGLAGYGVLAEERSVEIPATRQ